MIGFGNLKMKYLTIKKLIMADPDGKSYADKMAEFKPTMELQWLVTSDNFQTYHTLQQKHVNELGEEKWVDIPVVIK